MLTDCEETIQKQHRKNGALKEEKCGADYVKYRKYNPNGRPKIKESFIGGVYTEYRSDGQTIKFVGYHESK